MTRVIAYTVSALLVATAAQAHVSVRPRESKAGATENVHRSRAHRGQGRDHLGRSRNPAGRDGQLGRTGRRRQIRDEARRRPSRLDYVDGDDRSGQNRELVFVAKNPTDATEIVWKAHQRYADGTSSEWVGAAGTRQPAPVTKLAPAAGGGGQ